MSIVAISETVGSLGNEIGRELARLRSWEFADREIIEKTAERFGEGVMDLKHITEERPTLWERFSHTKRRYLAHVEAVIFEMATRDNVIFSGRGAAFLLAKLRNVLRVRINAPWRVRVLRLAHQRGCTEAEATDLVQRSDRELAGRVKFLFAVDWNDPLLYDVVLNTERLTVERGVRLIDEALGDERFRPTLESRKQLADFHVAAQVRAALTTSALRRPHELFATCKDGHVSITGTIDQETDRQTVENIVRLVPGVSGVRTEVEQRRAVGADAVELLEDQKERLHRAFPH
jgi:cytidylate kinase